MKLPTREQLEKRRVIVIADLLSKVEADDFHGVADCAMDCREIDAMLKTIDVFMDPLTPKAPFQDNHEHLFVFSAAHDCDICSCGAMRRMGLSRA